MPPDFLNNRFRSAQEIDEAIRQGLVEAVCPAPDHLPPKSLGEWESALEAAAKNLARPDAASLQLVHKRRPARSLGHGSKDDEYGYPDDVRQLGEAYQQLCHVERLLRDRVHEVLERQSPAFESDARLVPDEVRRVAMTAIEAEKRVLGEKLSSRLLDYVDFGFILDLVSRHWSVVGLDMERADWEQVKRESVQLRNAVMHSRRLKRHQRDQVSAVYSRVLRAFGINPYG